MTRTLLAARRAGAAPYNTAAPVLAGAVEIGLSPTVTPGTWVGAASLSYTLYRDSTAIVGPGASEATVEAYAYVAADIGASITLRETDSVSGTYATSGAVTFAHATYLPAVAIGVSTAGITTADAGATVDSWAASLGGVACTLTAIGATNRPAYSATGGVGSRPLVTFDGSDNIIKGPITKGSSWAEYEWGIVGRRVAFGAASDRWLTYYDAANPRWSLYDQTAATYRITVQGGASPTSTSDPDGVDAHYSADAASGGTQSIRKNGTVENSVASTTVSRADGKDVVLGADPTGAAAANIAVQAWYMGTYLTADQRTHLRALLSYHTGVSC